MIIYGRKPEPASIQGICTVEGCTTKQKPARNSKKERIYRALCNKHYRHSHGANAAARKPAGRRGYQRHRKLYCETCGPEVEYHVCQLDVDHIDGDHTNDDPDNLQTLCANCHRLKTFLNKEGIYAFHRP